MGVLVSLSRSQDASIPALLQRTSDLRERGSSSSSSSKVNISIRSPSPPLNNMFVVSKNLPLITLFITLLITLFPLSAFWVQCLILAQQRGPCHDVARSFLWGMCCLFRFGDAAGNCHAQLCGSAQVHAIAVAM